MRTDFAPLKQHQNKLQLNSSQPTLSLIYLNNQCAGATNLCEQTLQPSGQIA
jgi:hypothetical protein